MAALLAGGTAWAGTLSQAIDKHIAAKAGGPVAGQSNDSEFFRRAKLDFTGNIPTAAEVRAFLINKAADKRVKLIDQLLAGDEFARHWADGLSVMLLERQNLGKVPTDEWLAYLRTTLKGKPRWDVMVHDMIAATGKGSTRPAMKFLGNGNHHRLTEDIARLFLGMDLKCARCHDHPSVGEWKQVHYWGLYAYLNQTKQATHSGDKMNYFVEGLATMKVDFQSVFKTDKEAIGPKLPDSKEVVIPMFEKGKEFTTPATNGLPAVPKFLPRQELAGHLTSKDNHYFVRNAVNRIWFKLMGRGLSHPLSEVHSKNPPSHPKLFDALAKEFTAHQFDLKWLIREIALSESYQRSSRLPKGVKEVKAESWRTAHPKAMTPEQLLPAVLRATGNWKRVSQLKGNTEVKFNRRGYFTGTNLELPPSFEEVKALWMLTYAEPAGTPEVDFVPGLNKALFLMNDRMIQDWLKPKQGNLVERLTKLKTPEAIAEELYLSMLSRLPEADETVTVSEYLHKNEKRRNAALGDLAWALLTSTEFRLNH